MNTWISLDMEGPRTAHGNDGPTASSSRAKLLKRAHMIMSYMHRQLARGWEEILDRWWVICVLEGQGHYASQGRHPPRMQIMEGTTVETTWWPPPYHTCEWRQCNHTPNASSNPCKIVECLGDHKLLFWMFRVSFIHEPTTCMVRAEISELSTKGEQCCKNDLPTLFCVYFYCIFVWWHSFNLVNFRKNK